MRKLPIYFVLSIAESMKDEPIEAIQNGVQMFVSALRGEPQALEFAYISIITFSDVAVQLVPLTDLISFVEPNLAAVGGRALGAALELLCQRMDEEVTRPSNEFKGDFKPIVFIIIDGQPTDNWQKGADELKKRKATVVACAAGFDADTNVLKQITENVVELKSVFANDIAKYFKYQTVTIT